MLLLPFNAAALVSISLFLLLLLLSLLTNIGTSTSRSPYAAAAATTASETTRRQQRRVRGAGSGSNGIGYRNSIYKDNNNSKIKSLRQQQQLVLQQRELPDSRSLGLGGTAEEILFPEDFLLFNGDDDDHNMPGGGGGGDPNGNEPPARKQTAHPKGEDKVTNAVVDGCKETTLAPKTNTNLNGTTGSSTSSDSNDSEKVDDSSGNNDINTNDSAATPVPSPVITTPTSALKPVPNPWNDPQSSLSTIIAPTTSIPGNGGDSNANTNGNKDGVGGSSGNSNGVEENTNGEIEFGETSPNTNSSEEAKDLVCLSVSLQEPITSPEIEALTTTVSFSISIDVDYHTDVTSYTEIENFLDETNPAVAYWIAGCGKESELESNGADANDILATDKSVRRTRGLQQDEERAAPIVTYAELEPWSNTGKL